MSPCEAFELSLQGEVLAGIRRESAGGVRPDVTWEVWRDGDAEPFACFDGDDKLAAAGIQVVRRLDDAPQDRTDAEDRP
ncbi:MAG: hypothetical protein Kow00114_27420 [Kiloniellaceae bacterium]